MLESHDAEQVKSGLQRACEIFESGQAFTDPAFLKVGLAAHLSSPELKVRRWAYKLVALLKDADQLGLLEDALLRTEKDPENRGWASAAFSGLADDGRIARLTSRLPDYRGTSLELAAKLYARGEPSRDDLNLQVWQNEALARKWLCLLCGYARDNPRTIDQRFGDLDLVRNSVGDHDPENVEYSIWAEYRNPNGSYRSILRKPDELLAHANVRRWLYRLLTKDGDAATAYLDLLTERMNPAHEPSEFAREGLALGLATLPFEDRRIEAIEWFIDEPSPRVKLALVDHLAFMANKLDDVIARDALVADYSRHPGELIGVKIRSVARPEWGLPAFQLPVPPNSKFIPPRDLFALELAANHGPVTQIYVAKQEVHVVNNKVEQSGSNNSMTGVVAGDMIQSTINALSRQEDTSLRELTPIIERFLTALAASGIDESEKRPVIEAAAEVAKATGEEKKSKLATLKGLARGVLRLPGMAAEAVKGGEELVEAIQHVIS
ncbi:hypothetical protein [Allosphingosinicella deserti]|uniref:Uncharacterized protein n=1 Tax=Allosphingosinicella deserti TaxID=2116704 RepID=A0A2P7QF75_9SPHN|nr:hypothetical protein [Sphingomonas deserti]PSJ36627.1 hypothetical protein C7I55_24860 [Sphingomonas deserti]